MKKILLIAAVGIVSAAYSQKGNTSSAGIAYGNYEKAFFSGDMEEAAAELKDAKEFIDKSYVHEETKDDPKTLMYYGKIYIAIPQVAAVSGDEVLKAVDGEKAVQDGFAALKRSKEVDSKGRYHSDVDDYCNMYRSMLANQGIKFYEEEKWLEAMGGLVGAGMFGEVMGLSDSIYYFYGGLAAYNIDSMSTAAEAFSKTLEWGYQPGTSAYYYSQALQKQGKTGDAEKMLKDAVAKYPNNKDILIEMINIYIDSDRKEEAVQALKDAIALDPNNAQLAYTAGTIYENMNDFENAEKSYLKALELNPKDANMMSALGGVYFNKGAELNNEANKLEFGDPKYDGMVAESKEYFKKSIPYLEQATQASPDDVNFWIALKEAYGKAGEVEKFKEAKAKVAELQAK
ncbi:tetratricopeptide repeat protein [Paracrocinitomix mangrovi]|uniref:tetratricopeptide repeat protein n=1 Tax=Paracrocinitomix mangrovi TaxID=2862509 RepID=UPI001C8D61E4|nr:tetratricopeptide repeat protein [Paracrocinitomix mangrovi]UKN02306.1 tetratricopeptide repeat protein [Paracrocinitomix mangrovi]